MPLKVIGGAMARFQARLKPEYRLKYPDLSINLWYDVVPLFPGLRERRLNFMGDRVARLRVAGDFREVQADQVEFREVPDPATPGTK
jgi:hypothetical protein